MSGKNFARFERGERVDLPDFEHIAEIGPRDAINSGIDAFTIGRRGIGGVASDGLDQDLAFILRGFDVQHAGGSRFTILKDDIAGEGAAILGFRDRGETAFGCVISGGQSQKTIDLSSVASGTYGVWLKFEFRDDCFGNRLFWNASAATPVEFARNVPTRRAQDWIIAVELTKPGPEYIQIATVPQAGGTPTDTRNFFFEGSDVGNHLVIDAEWGASFDRGNFRAGQGVFGLYRFVRAMQRMLQDVKGDGVGWWVAPAVALEDVLDLAATRSIGGTLTNDTPDTYDFGASGSRWATGFFNNLNFSSVLTGVTATLSGVVSTTSSMSASTTITAGTRCIGGDLETQNTAPGTLPTESRVYSDTIIRAWGHVITDGAGGITSQDGVGYTASIAGTLLRITFDNSFNTSDDYVLVGMFTDVTAARILVTSARTAAKVDIGGFDDTGAGLNFSTAVRSVDFMIIGRL